MPRRHLSCTLIVKPRSAVARAAGDDPGDRTHMKSLTIRAALLAAMTLAAALAGMDAAAAQTTAKTDYDLDDNGLVEISNPAQPDAMRCDLDGDGAAVFISAPER